MFINKVKENYSQLYKIWLIIVNGLLVISFLFNHSFTNIILIFLGITFIIKFKSLRAITTHQLIFITVSGVMFLYILGVSFLSASFPDNLKLIERYGLLLAMPLMLFSFTELKKEIILWCFNGIVVLSAIYCMSIGVYNFLASSPTTEPLNGDMYNNMVSRWNFISYERLLSPLGLTPAYISLIVSFTSFCIFFCKEISRYMRLVYACILIIFLFLVGSRMGVIGFGVTFVTLLVKGFYQNSYSKRKVILSLVAIVAIFLVTILSNDYLKKRFTEDLSSFEIVDSIEAWNSISLRLAIWKCNIKAAEENPFWGIGFQEDLREKCYSQYSFYGHYLTNPDAHNQFLDFYYIGGIPLLLLYLLYLGYPIVYALKTNNNLLLVLLILISTHSLAESPFSKIHSIYFIAYFIPFLLPNSAHEKPK